MSMIHFSEKFVCEDTERSSYAKHIAAPVFRKSFFIAGKVRSAKLVICGLGFYELFINGTKITKGYLAPYISNPNHMVYYDDYNLTPFLKEGENVIGVMLGDGFQNEKTVAWDFRKNVFNASPKLALCAEIEDEKGLQTFNAEDFRCKKGPVLFNDLRSGIFFDKRREDIGWKEPGFLEDASWHSPLIAEKPKGKAKLCEAEPIVVQKQLRPVAIYQGELIGFEEQKNGSATEPTQETPPPKTGGWVYDFGENNAGIFRLKVRGRPGQRIDIQCAERAENGNPDYSNWKFFPTGYACPDGYMQRDIYIVAGEDEEVFEPMFTYHGFRYLYVSGITEEQATQELLTYLVMSSDLEERGSFSCSNSIANAVYAMGRRSDISNFYYFPTDCPHREKHGWTNDAWASAEHMIMTLGTEKSWRQWLNNIRCAQKQDGKLPQIVPTGEWGYEGANGPSFNGILFALPYLIWRYRGNLDAVYDNIQAMKTYLKYVSSKRNENGLVEIGLGDWMIAAKAPHLYTTPLGFSDSVLAYEICRMATEMFVAVGDEDGGAYASNLGKELYEAIRKEYLDISNMTIESQCQTAQAMGLYYGIFKECEKEAAFRQLLKIIHQNGDKLDSGALGLRVIFHVLAQNGETELAYKMITQGDFPSYGWYAMNGYTTLPEHFVNEKVSWGVSENHHMFGDVVQWFMRYPAGLQVENFETIKIKPSILKELDFAEASHMLPAGKVAVSWKRNGKEIALEASWPDSVSCTVEEISGYTIKHKDIVRKEKQVFATISFQ